MSGTSCYNAHRGQTKMSSFAANPTHSSRLKPYNPHVVSFLLSLPKADQTRNDTKFRHKSTNTCLSFHLSTISYI